MRASSFIRQQLAIESIEFQSPMFFKELTVAFEALKGEKKEDIGNSEAAVNVIRIVKHYTGLNIGVDFGAYEPCVDIPAVDKNNPLINSFIRNYVSSADGLKMIANAEGVARGTVSLKTGKVSGVFSEMPAKIYMPVDMLAGNKYSAGEIAAIFLHEVGHLITYCEYISRSVTTNQVLAGMAKSLDGSGTIEEREAVFIGVKKALNLSQLDTKKLAQSTSRKTAEVVVITSVTRECESELGSNVYDFSSWEMLADQYVTRFGAGRDLATALDKLYRGTWNISFRSLPAYLAFEAFKLLTLVIAPAIAVTLMGMDGAGDGTYDRPGARLKRVRNQIVENLKREKLSKDDQQRLAADLEAVDEVLASINDRRQFFGVLWDAISPASRRAYNQERLQRELEDLATNDLFVKAAELKQLA